MPTNSEIEKDQYDKINTLTGRVEQLVGAVDVANQINLELMKLLKKALAYEFWVIIILIAALVYGAIGEKGLYSVRQVIPVPSSDGQASLIGNDMAPWNDRKIVKVTNCPFVA